ncbi:MAG TPA: NADH-quinone oxidoreductase subunit C [Phycisphaerae bacterium]|jgi:NADH-quinone oxidoreductase subunit C|nr:NADH-quinone oxidoreductase subunit C [Phycisphaerae bacterium]HOB73561.1 NADH-quinone oxidoreductase subunit C [Phycisphaerae bacterium]HOJ55818.1 NADH-quinone oxidoreductase subunit C [Phycisphaerae bacterium]HOL25814.1 NADH-quinone oxidoreductase subunit C [Phycisphaerae bacterium]HPP21312.1 NADH-quinone oxidoreductase subunit C [Phycisphaerae bacterium]
MTPEVIAETVKAAMDGAVVDMAMSTGHPSITVSPERWHEVALFLRDDPRLRLNFLRCISGIDWLEKGEIEVVYDLMSVRPGAPDALCPAENVIAVRVRVPRDGGHIPSVADVWPAADWHEREVYDMFGVIFDGHPDFRRILCPEDWVGYPLRKDYEYPLEYHGIPGTTEFGQKSPRH